MKDYYIRLLKLLDQLPNGNSNYNAQQLKKLALEYGSILNNVSETNEFYKRNTELYHSELRDIDRKIHTAAHGMNQKQKDDSFNDARSGLRLDMDALASLIKGREGLETI